MLKKVVQLKKRMISVQYFSDDPMNLKNYIRSGQCDQGTVHVFLSQVASALHYPIHSTLFMEIYAPKMLQLWTPTR